MIYDKLPVTLLSVLATERAGTTNASIARYLVTHAGELGSVSIKGVARACNVGVGSVSRFCRDAGFSGFDELRQALEEARQGTQPETDGNQLTLGAREHAQAVGESVMQVAETIDGRMLQLLVDDLHAYETVFTCGMLKAQSAAVDLQVDLLMAGKYVETCVSYAEQTERIATASRDTLVVVFSYTGSYFDACDLSSDLARIDRPRIWVVAGTRHPQPDYVYGCLTFDSDLNRLAHPFQLEMAAARIAQVYAQQGSKAI